MCQSDHEMKLRKGDFESEVTAVYPALMRAATVLCWSRSDVEDVVQDALLRAFSAYPSFKGESSFLTWAYAILSRVAQAANRRGSRLVPDDYTMNQPQQIPPLDHAVVVDEDARLLIDAIRSLPERQREMLTLRFLEELSYNEIAEALKVSLGTVKATVFQAKMSLRSALAKKGIHRKVIHVLS